MGAKMDVLFSYIMLSLFCIVMMETWNLLRKLDDSLHIVITFDLTC